MIETERALWAWINENPDVRSGGQGFQGSMPKIATADFVATMREFNGGIPWRSLLASMNLLDSHDTARMRNIVGGNRELHTAAMALLLTYPGLPSIFAGDEIGLEGAWGETARKTMPWGKEETWDQEFLAITKKLISIRKSQSVLAEGSLRFLEIGEDYFTFTREGISESVVVFISRKPGLTPTGNDLENCEELFTSSTAKIWHCTSSSQ
jgi:alpha-glucosidase